MQYIQKLFLKQFGLILKEATHLVAMFALLGVTGMAYAQGLRPPCENAIKVDVAIDATSNSFWNEELIERHAICLRQQELFHSVWTAKDGWNNWGRVMNQAGDVLQHWKFYNFDIESARDDVLQIVAYGFRVSTLKTEITSSGRRRTGRAGGEGRVYITRNPGGWVARE